MQSRIICLVMREAVMAWKAQAVALVMMEDRVEVDHGHPRIILEAGMKLITVRNAYLYVFRSADQGSSSSCVSITRSGLHSIH